MKNEKMNLFENLQNLHEAEKIEEKDYIKYTQLMEKAAYDEDDEMTEAEVKLANSDEGREYAISEFRRFHKVDEYIAISNRYQIIRGEDGLYYPHVKYKSTSRAFHSLESALLGMIVYDKIADDDIHLNKYIFKLLDIEW